MTKKGDKGHTSLNQLRQKSVNDKNEKTISWDEEHQFSMGFAMGNSLGISRRETAWLQSKVYDGSMRYNEYGFLEELETKTSIPTHFEGFYLKGRREGSLDPQRNSFVKGFVRSQHRSALIKTTHFTLNIGGVTGDHNRRKNVLERYRRIFEKDKKAALEKYCMEKLNDQRNRSIRPEFRRHITTKVKSSLKKEMKIRNREMDKDM